MKRLNTLFTLVFVFLAISAYSLPIDFKQLIGSHTPVFTRPTIVRQITEQNDNIEGFFYQGIVFLDEHQEKHPIVRSKNLQLFPLKMISNDLVYCVNRVKEQSPDEDEYYLVNVKTVNKYNEISLNPVEFNIANSDFFAFFSNFNPISVSQLNCFFSSLLNNSSGNYTWNDEFQKQDYIQNKINLLNQNKYQTIGQKKDYFVTFRGALGQYDFQSNSFPVRVKYLADFSSSFVNIPFDVAFESESDQKQIDKSLFSSPNQKFELWSDFRQVDNIEYLTYKIDPNTARTLISRLNSEREVLCRVNLSPAVLRYKENLNCSSDYYSSNDVNFLATSLIVTPVQQEEESGTSEASQVVSPELESLLESKVGLEEEIETNLKEDNGDEIFTSVEQQAEFPGGPRAFGAFLQKNLRYPSAAQRANVGGKVYVQFVVNTDGSIQDLQILKSVGYGCDEEAIRVIKAVPRWTPGKLSGRPVRSRFTQPITFVLSE